MCTASGGKDRGRLVELKEMGRRRPKSMSRTAGRGDRTGRLSQKCFEPYYSTKEDGNRSGTGRSLKEGHRRFITARLPVIKSIIVGEGDDLYDHTARVSVSTGLLPLRDTFNYATKIHTCRLTKTKNKPQRGHLAGRFWN